MLIQGRARSTIWKQLGLDRGKENNKRHAPGARNQSAALTTTSAPERDSNVADFKLLFQQCQVHERWTLNNAYIFQHKMSAPFSQSRLSSPHGGTVRNYCHDHLLNNYDQNHLHYEQ